MSRQGFFVITSYTSKYAVEMSISFVMLNLPHPGSEASDDTLWKWGRFLQTHPFSPDFATDSIG